MPALNFVEVGEIPTTVNVLLYGPPGTGKSVGACSAPGPILAVNAEGPGALRFARKHHGEQTINEVRFENAATLDAVYAHLKNGGEEKTVIVDTLGEVYDGLLKGFSRGGKPTLQNYGDVNQKLDGFIRALRDLDVNVVLLAHEQVDDSEGEITRRPATGGKKLPEKVMAQMDVVGFTGVTVDEEKKRHYVAQLIDGNGRRAKDRSGVLGATRKLDLSEWIEAIAEDSK